MWYSTLFTGAALVAFMAARVLESGAASSLKMVTSTGFLAMAIAAGGFQSTYGRIILAALLFSWWGDLFLISGKENMFLLGLIAFFLAHVAFSGAFLSYGVDGRWLAIALAVALIPLGLVSVWLHPHLGTMRIPVYAYTAIITVMVACAFGAWGRGATRLIVLGAVAFYLSDLFVARARFVTPGPWNGHIGLPLYYAGQMLFAISIFRVNAAQDVAQTSP